MSEALVLLLSFAAVGLGSAWFAARPLWRRTVPPGDPFASRDGALSERKEVALSALEELERDYRVGSLEEADYRALRAELAGSAVLALKAEAELERTLDALVEEEVAARRGRAAAAPRPGPGVPPACPACGRPRGPDDRFCSRCGSTLAPRPAATHAGRRPPGSASDARAVRATRARGAGRWLAAGGLLIVAFLGGVGWLALNAPGRATQGQQPLATLPAPAVRALAVDPGEPARLFAGASVGALASTDGGRTWQPLDVAGDVTALATPGARPGSLYVAGPGLFSRSGDGGRTWQSLLDRLPAGEVRALAGDPSDAAVLYAAVVGAGLLRTADAGATWATAGPLPAPDVTALVAVPAAPGHPAMLFLASPQEGVLASMDGGAGWDNANGFVNGALPTRRVLSLAYDPNSGDRFEGPAGMTFRGALYAGTDRGLFKTTDGGTTWVRLPLEAAVAAVAASPADSRVLLAVDIQGRLFRSQDRGLTWPGRAP